jgi:hypothetical protein
MATLDARTVEALNSLLEDERGSVEIEVQLTNGATEIVERITFNEMGYSDVLGCSALRERLDEAGAAVSPHISGAAPYILGIDTYDERLLAFARHQEAIRERAQAILESTADHEARSALQDIVDTHTHYELWCVNRARDFAESRARALAEETAGAALANGESNEPQPATPPSISTPIPPATLTAMQDAALANGPEPNDSARRTRRRTRSEPAKDDGATE